MKENTVKYGLKSAFWPMVCLGALLMVIPQTSRAASDLIVDGVVKTITGGTFRTVLVKNSGTLNTSGGLKACGHPVAATGVKQAVEAVMQLRGQGGKWQVKGAEIGATYNVGGSGATACVHVFKKGK